MLAGEPVVNLQEVVGLEGPVHIGDVVGAHCRGGAGAVRVVGEDGVQHSI